MNRFQILRGEELPPLEVTPKINYDDSIKINLFGKLREGKIISITGINGLNSSIELEVIIDEPVSFQKPYFGHIVQQILPFHWKDSIYKIHVQEISLSEEFNLTSNFVTKLHLYGLL